MHILETQRLCHTYADGTEALRRVDLRVNRSEVVAVLGANGAGKTTLLKHLNGLLSPTSGRVLVAGEEIKKENLLWVRKTVGLVFQNPEEQLFAPSVEEDVAFGPRNLGLSEDVIAHRVQEALRLVGMQGYEEKAPHNLSYGEKKRIAIAGVLAMEPQVLVLDEPASGLDPLGTEELVRLLRRLRSLGLSLVIATHDVDLVPMLADRIYLLHRGSVVGEGTAEEIFTSMDEAARYSLRLPYVAQLLLALREMGIDVELRLTVEEAAKEVARHLGAGDI
ncbi:ATP-binding cassette domain-containing protein [Candidatus Pyrohabitans sp.]